MISWIQFTFHRHFRIIFFVLLAVLIVSFVFTIGAAPGIGGAKRKVQAPTYFDLNLSSPDDQARLYRDANLSLTLQAGFQEFSEAQLQEFALERYATLFLADEFNLPGPSESEFEEFIKIVPAFQGPDGFDGSVYANFRDNPELSAQFNRVLRNDYRVREIHNLLGGPGYVLPGEVAHQLERTATVWSVDVARIDYETYAPAIEPTDDQLQSYFDAHSFRYQTAPQVRVSYVEYLAASHRGQIQLSEQDIRAYYEANPARFPRPEKTDVESLEVGTTDPDIDYLAVRDQVAAAMRTDGTRRLAAEAAADLTVALFDAAPAPAEMGEFVAGQGATLRAADPFDRLNPPLFLSTAPQHVPAAFSLSAERRISDALPTAAGAVVLIWEESIPSMPSAFAEVIEQVKSDYQETERRQQFVALGQTATTTLRGQVAAGMAWVDAVAGLGELAGAAVETVSFTEFTRLDPPEDFPGAALASLEGLADGQVSDMVLPADEGVITYVVSREIPAIEATDPRYIELRNQLASFNAGTIAGSVMTELVSDEF